MWVYVDVQTVAKVQKSGGGSDLTLPDTQILCCVAQFDSLYLSFKKVQGGVQVAEKFAEFNVKGDQSGSDIVNTLIIGNLKV